MRLDHRSNFKSCVGLGLVDQQLGALIGNGDQDDAYS